MKKIVAVIGGAKIKSEEIRSLAFDTGREIASRGYMLACGGMGGVMEECAKGAKSAGGVTIGILPGTGKSDANAYIDIPIVTAMSHARNAILVRTADLVIAVDGEFGTMSEIGLAKCCDKAVYGIKTFEFEGVIKVPNAKEALDHFEGT